MTDWRLPENRREVFLRFYDLNLRFQDNSGCMYSLLRALADHYSLDLEGRAWLAYLVGHTQNIATTKLLLDAAPTPEDWYRAVQYYEENRTRLRWDTDRRYLRKSFAQDTADYILGGGLQAGERWLADAEAGWEAIWRRSMSLPSFGRFSAWGLIEYARILIPQIPDSPTLLLGDASGSKSHRNGLLIMMGYPATRWSWTEVGLLGITVEQMEAFGADLLAEARERFSPPEDTVNLTLESALCAYKQWHKPNATYIGKYADDVLRSIRDAEKWSGADFSVLMDARQRDLPWELRPEDNPRDPGPYRPKTNLYLETGVPYGFGAWYPDMMTDLEREILG